MRTVVPAALLIVLLGGGGLAALETDTVGSFGDGIWWALSLVTTVGFTGGPPHTAAGKVLSAVLMVLGFAFLSLTTAAIASLFVQEDERPEEQREQAFEGLVLDELRRMSERLDRIERGQERPPGEG